MYKARAFARLSCHLFGRGSLFLFGAHLFPGGIHPREGVNGKAENSANPIQELPAVSRVVIPLSQHIGAPATATVKKGDHVLMGQVIGEASGFVSAPVHASVSGTVVEVGTCKLASGATVPAVTIDNDFQDEWVELHPNEHPENLSPEEAQQIIRDQAALMAAHDIETESGALEEQRARLLADIEKNT